MKYVIITLANVPPYTVWAPAHINSIVTVDATSPRKLNYNSKVILLTEDAFFKIKFNIQYKAEHINQTAKITNVDVWY